MSAELLPCPFCGSKAAFKPYKRDGLTLKCRSLGCVVFNQRTLHGLDWLQSKMIEHWNARAGAAVRTPLTDEEIRAICKAHLVEGYNGDYLEDDGFHLARAIEAAHGIQAAPISAGDGRPD